MELEQRMDLHRRLVAGDLRIVNSAEGFDESPDLSDVDVIVGSLKSEDPDWSVLHAAAVHILRARSYLPEVLDRFQEDEIAKLEEVVFRTSANPPNVPPNLHQSPISLEHDPYWSSYFHSRCALAMLIDADEPERAIQLLAPLRDFFPPRANVSQSWDISRTGRQIVWGLLKHLCERTEDYRSALEMSLVGSLGFGSVEGFQEVRLYLDGLGQQLWDGSASVADVTFLFDSCRSVLRQCRSADDFERDELSECEADTLQYWAWTYGCHVARLVHFKPHVSETLLDHVQSTDWEDGWPAISLIFESSHVREWARYRNRALTLYNTASVEYGGSGVPFGATVPAHFSPEGDLYWAARVGFSETMLSLKGGSPAVDLTTIQQELATLRDIASSHSQRSLRSERELAQNLDRVQAALSRASEHVREDLRQIFGLRWPHIPADVVDHLIVAERLWDSGVQPDQVRTELAKAVEAMVHSLMLEPGAEQARTDGMTDLRVEFSAPGRRPSGFPVINWRYMSFGHWAELLERTGQPGSDPYVNVMFAVYPAFATNRASGIASGLRQIANFRGASAHHSNQNDFESAMGRADEMRKRVLGSESNESLLTQTLECFGVLS